jgi:hypothetical protein
MIGAMLVMVLLMVLLLVMVLLMVLLLVMVLLMVLLLVMVLVLVVLGTILSIRKTIYLYVFQVHVAAAHEILGRAAYCPDSSSASSRRVMRRSVSCRLARRRSGCYRWRFSCNRGCFR